MTTRFDNSVVDFFCGAGGFSEGFRQAGFKIISGYDSYSSAIDTFNLNFNLELEPKDILDFETSIEEINNIPSTSVIIGSPPCVSFSNSNKSGKADKSLGLRLTETFLRIVAVKKFEHDSKLVAWFMENVPNSLKYIKSNYTFEDLNLAKWAKENNLSPSKVAIQIQGNSMIINSADYGSPQRRVRAISGEYIETNNLTSPPRTHSDINELDLPPYRTLGDIRKKIPSPFSKLENVYVPDPSYPLKLKPDFFTDHFYDTGLYECEWRNSRFLKQNHPFMGRMSFPENLSKPSRTLCATNIGTSRESIIYRSESSRKGDGEYRTPTVREAAIIMGFPITFQFSGAMGSKMRQVGNAVCPHVSRAFALGLKKSLGLDISKKIIVNRKIELDKIINLNDSPDKTYDNPPQRNKGARFRRHPFKIGNITVTLSNYNIENNRLSDKWITSVQYGNGAGFPNESYPDKYYETLEDSIKSFKGGKAFLTTINNGFSEKVASADKLQEMFESRMGSKPFLEPTLLIERVAELILNTDTDKVDYDQENTWHFTHKKKIPVKQLFALYAINKITTIANTQ